MEKIRLQKYLSECGLMSRRAAEAEISDGKIKINGIIAKLGDRVDPEHDTVEFAGKIIAGDSCGSRRNTYILLNKPVGYVTTMSDERGRPTIAELIADVGVRLYPAGRLDMYSDGILICSNDGELTNRLTHPSHKIAKKYLATITSHLSADDIATLAVPFELDGYMLRPFTVELVDHKTIAGIPSTIVRFTLYEGRNREIRKICAHHGYKLSRLSRTDIGEITVGALPAGKWRHLTETEISYLKNI